MSSYPAKVRAEALRIYQESTVSAREVAEQLGLNTWTVSRWISEAGLSRSRNATREYPLGVKRKAAELYASGLTQRQVAKSLNVGEGTVWRWLSKLGLTRCNAYAAAEGQRKYLWPTVVAVGAMREAGATYREIEAETGVPSGSIRGLLRQWEAYRKEENRRFSAHA